MERFHNGARVIARLKEAGFDAYFVGGAVRDYVRGAAIKDIDVATSATPTDVQQLFVRTVDVGAAHGTIIVLDEGEPIEVTTYRTEATYEQHRRPEAVQFVRSLHEDLRRRDFTMNAMAMSENEEIIDLFGGYAAIQRKEIATVGRASERFFEDALRMLRAVRFQSQLQMTIAPDTEQAMTEHAALLAHISVERMTMELEKLLAGSGVQRALQTLVTTGLYQHMPFPPLDWRAVIAYDWTRTTTTTERLAILFSHTIEKTTEATLRQWKLPLKVMKDVLTLIEVMSEWTKRQWTKWDVYQVGADVVETACRLQQYELDRQLVTFPIASRHQLAVNGHDLVAALQRRHGPWLKESLLTIERAVVEGTLQNDKATIVAFVAEKGRTE